MSNPSEKSKNELIKEASRGLRGSVRRELAEDSPSFSAENTQVLKFHGVYQQDDRDVRRERLAVKQGKAYQFMLRLKNPGGGKLSPEQWAVLDAGAGDFADGTLRITTRQALQFHGVGKKNLQKLICLLNSRLLTTYGACGDGNRNTLACPVSSIREGSSFDGQYWARLISESLAFRSTAYYEVWLNGEKLSSADADVAAPAAHHHPEYSEEAAAAGQEQEDPIYGKAYLPRKFKIAIADPRDNCVDVLTNDVGIIPVMESGSLAGFQVTAGGGLGSSHGARETYPRLASPLCFVAPELLAPVVKAIVLAYRDLGDRKNRKHARLKYVVEEAGIEGFRREVEQRLGRTLPLPRKTRLQRVESHLGWHRQKDPRFYYLGIFVENGRIRDCEGKALRTAIREVTRRFGVSIILTPTQDLILCDVPAARVLEVNSLLDGFGVPSKDAYSRLRLAGMACPALPTCGLALTEAERRLPGLITQLEKAGFGEEEISIRMAGCPNSCSRPPVAEIGLIGRSADGYHVYLGGSRLGVRLAQLYEEDVSSDQLAALLGRLIQTYRQHRRAGERFGDWSHRLGMEQLRRLCGGSQPERKLSAKTV